MWSAAWQARVAGGRGPRTGYSCPPSGRAGTGLTAACDSRLRWAGCMRLAPLPMVTSDWAGRYMRAPSRASRRDTCAPTPLPRPGACQSRPRSRRLEPRPARAGGGHRGEVAQGAAHQLPVAGAPQPHRLAVVGVPLGGAQGRDATVAGAGVVVDAHLDGSVVAGGLVLEPSQ